MASKVKAESQRRLCRRIVIVSALLDGGERGRIAGALVP
jgi:hypothetical protein